MEDKELQNLIVIYENKDGINLEVNVVEDTVWLTQPQIATLFGVLRPAIVKHINNIFISDELDKDSVCSILEHTASDGKKYKIQYYNLDLIISVGYRVNSTAATQFRIWATKTLKKYLLEGYVVNEKRILEKEVKKLKEFQETIKFITDKINKEELSGKEKEILNVIKDYTRSFQILNQYDEDRLENSNLEAESSFALNYKEAQEFIKEMKNSLEELKENVQLFGQERSDDLKGILGTIYQTFAENELYPSIEEKAAHLLYFVIKDHPFIDGNKRIGAGLFVYFLDKNNYLKNKGTAKINDTGLVTLALLIAQSNPKDKEIMIKLIINLITNQ